MPPSYPEGVSLLGFLRTPTANQGRPGPASSEAVSRALEGV